MATAAAKKKAGSASVTRSKDKEVATREHDALLTWLIEHLGEVADGFFGKDDEWREAQIAAAKKDAAGRWERLASSLSHYTEDDATVRVDQIGNHKRTAVSPAARKTLSEGVRLLRSWAKGLEFGMPAKEAGEATVEAYEVMKQVSRLEFNGNERTTKRSPAGFVDLVATLRVPESLVLHARAAEANQNALDGMFATEKRLTEWVRGLQAEKVTWAREQVKQEVWFTVRSGAFTLGEILQELKALQQLESGRQHIVLCVQSMSDAMVAHIEHEDFSVVAADDWD